MKKINVAQAVNQLSIGGTEKTIEVFAHHLDKSIFDVSIYALFAGGARYDRLQKAFKTRLINGDQAELVKWFREDRIDILHVHRSGYEEPFALEAAQKAGVPVIVETKIFGGVDNSPSGKLIDKSIFVSKMCALRYLKKQHLTVDEFFEKNAILYNPIELDNYQISVNEILAFKSSLGIKASDFVLGRISRPDPFKFGDVCLKMLPYLLQDVPNIKYIIVGCPPSKIKIIQQLKLEKRIILIPEISDEKELSLFYNSLDVYAYSAFHGESFGITIAEAMAHRKPVIVNSTPAIDNAQVELVDHARTGFIANSAKTYANAIKYLYANQSALERMGQAGYRKVYYEYNARDLSQQLGQLYFDLYSQKRLRDKKPLEVKKPGVKLAISAPELAAFEPAYELRKKMDFDIPYNLGLLKRLFYKPSSDSNRKQSCLCPIDNLPGVTYFTYKNNILFQICPICGLVYRKYLSDIAYSDDESYKGYITRENQLYQDFTALFRPILKHKTQGTLLDIGCNYGLLMKVAFDFGFKVVGNELSQSSAEYGRNKFGFDIYPTTTEAAGFPGNSFDVIIMNHVLEHTRDPLGLLNEVLRILKTDGVIMIGLPNFGCRECQIDPVRWKYLLGHGHNFQFSLETLSALLNKAGFQVIEVPEQTDNLVVIANKTSKAKTYVV